MRICSLDINRHIKTFILILNKKPCLLKNHTSVRQTLKKILFGFEYNLDEVLSSKDMRAAGTHVYCVFTRVNAEGADADETTCEIETIDQLNNLE